MALNALNMLSIVLLSTVFSIKQRVRAVFIDLTIILFYHYYKPKENLTNATLLLTTNGQKW